MSNCKRDPLSAGSSPDGQGPRDPQDHEGKKCRGKNSSFLGHAKPIKIISQFKGIMLK
jgi:hypothetical protein